MRSLFFLDSSSDDELPVMFRMGVAPQPRPAAVRSSLASSSVEYYVSKLIGEGRPVPEDEHTLLASCWPEPRHFHLRVIQQAALGHDVTEQKSCPNAGQQASWERDGWEKDFRFGNGSAAQAIASNRLFNPHLRVFERG
ncbi:unnamed protein product [Rangifer tarandus platyrhynchus]|uniref:Uncharacterized protein n=2 Tax=Rangifer tarandus platyrhynchus TaxID=3082113 RepID=A0ABN9A2T1_RANTA|nr:unnamed protein product [Rangifer tarandus platyrhynchus]